MPARKEVQEITWPRQRVRWETFRIFGGRRGKTIWNFSRSRKLVHLCNPWWLARIFWLSRANPQLRKWTHLKGNESLEGKVCVPPHHSMLFKEKNHSLLPELWLDKGNTPSKLPSFSRARCKHLSITPMKPLQSGSSPLPALLSYHHCLPCPHTPAYSTLHRAPRSLHHTSAFGTCFPLTSISTLTCLTKLHSSLKIQLTCSLLWKDIPGQSYSTPLYYQFSHSSTFNEIKCLCIFSTPGTIVKEIFIN